MKMLSFRYVRGLILYQVRIFRFKSEPQHSENDEQIFNQLINLIATTQSIIHICFLPAIRYETITSTFLVHHSATISADKLESVFSCYCGGGESCAHAYLNFGGGGGGGGSRQQQQQQQQVAGSRTCVVVLQFRRWIAMIVVLSLMLCLNRRKDVMLSIESNSEIAGPFVW